MPQTATKDTFRVMRARVPSQNRRLSGSLSRVLVLTLSGFVSSVVAAVMLVRLGSDIPVCGMSFLPFQRLDMVDLVICLQNFCQPWVNLKEVSSKNSACSVVPLNQHAWPSKTLCFVRSSSAINTLQQHSSSTSKATAMIFSRMSPLDSPPCRKYHPRTQVSCPDLDLS